MSRAADTLDLAAVARRTGLTEFSIRTYHNNGTLPVPDGTAGQSPWWFSETIDDWAAARARASRRRDLCQLVPTSADTWEAWIAGQHVGYVVTGEGRTPGSSYFYALPLSAAGHPTPRLAAVGYGPTPGNAALAFVGALVQATAADQGIAEQVAATSTERELGAVSELSQFLADAKGDRTIDEIAAEAQSQGHALGRSTVAKYLSGKQPRHVSESMVRAIAAGFKVDESDVRRLAGRPPGELGPWQPPAESVSLTAQQRQALNALILSMVNGGNTPA